MQRLNAVPQPIVVLGLLAAQAAGNVGDEGTLAEVIATLREGSAC